MLKSTVSSVARDRTHKVECFISVSPNPHRLRGRQDSRQASTFPLPINVIVRTPTCVFLVLHQFRSLCALNNPIYPVGASSLKRLCAVRVRDLRTRQSCPTLPLFRPPEPASITPRPSR